MADDPIKEWNRRRPFQRIHNEKFIPKDPPDGFGVACGCRTPADFGDFKDEFTKYFLDKVKSINRIKNFLQKAKKAAEGVSSFLSRAAAALAAIAFLASAGATLGSAGAFITKVLDGISKVTAKILDLLDKGLKEIFARLGFRIIPRAIRAIPKWVPVDKAASNKSVTADQIVEVEGLAMRSYANPIEVPFRQWHLWHNWNIHVLPEPEYRNITSPADNPPNTGGAELEEPPIAREGRGTFEVQWDMGALLQNRSDFETGFPASSMRFREPMMTADWCWPMTGMHVWAAGRWVYDCSRTTNDSANPQMCTMLNPCKAIATARHRAFKFVENEFAVPAIQFMFFACKRGGYIDHAQLNEADYEFILDLPRIELKRAPFAIDDTSEVPHNTIVLRPRLLKNLDFTPFKVAGGVELEPILAPIPEGDPNEPPKQIKVKVPLTKLPAEAEAMGFILSLGWFDPNLEQARKVKKCQVKFTKFTSHQVRDSTFRELRSTLKEEEKDLIEKIKKEIRDIELFSIAGFSPTVGQIPGVNTLVNRVVGAATDKLLDFLESLTDRESEEWMLRIGVNGEWKARYFPSVKEKKETAFPSPAEFTLHLGPQDSLSFAVSGMELDPVGDIMRARRSQRIITLEKQEAPWVRIVKPDPDPEKAKKLVREMVFEYVLKVLVGPKDQEGFLSLGMENAPLGFVDPVPEPNSTNSNPISFRQLKGGEERNRKWGALFARAAGEQMILVENLKRLDYEIFYDLKVEDQIPQPKPATAGAA